MDQVVIDASVAVKWFVVEPYSNEALRVLDTYQSGKAFFHAPDLLPSEFANTIWKKQLFQGLAEADAKDERFVNALTGSHSQVIWVGNWP